MKLAIIGGSGFIGTKLASLCKEELIDFVIIDKNKSYSHPDQWVYGDVTIPESLLEPLKDSTCIINLAAEHKDNVNPISRYYDVNVQGAKNVCEIATRLDIQHIIFTSSVAVYGFVEQETAEDGVYNPFNDYGQSKLDAELVYSNWQAIDKERKLVIVRPTVVFGEGNRGNVYHLFAKIAVGKFLMIGNGLNEKSMAYIDNIAAFLLFSISLKKEKLIFNYVDKPDYNMKELIALIYATLHKKKCIIHIPYSMGLLGGYLFDLLAKCLNREFSVSSIRIRKFCAQTQFRSDTISQTGFKPPVSLKKGIINTIENEFIEKK